MPEERAVGMDYGGKEEDKDDLAGEQTIFWNEIAKLMDKSWFFFRPKAQIMLKENMTVLQSRQQIRRSRKFLMLLSLPGAFAAWLFFYSWQLKVHDGIFTFDHKMVDFVFGCCLTILIFVVNGVMTARVSYFTQYEEMVKSGRIITIMTQLYRSQKREVVTMQNTRGLTNARRSVYRRSQIVLDVLKSKQEWSRGEPMRGSSDWTPNPTDFAEFSAPPPGVGSDHCGFKTYPHNIGIKLRARASEEGMFAINEEAKGTEKSLQIDASVNANAQSTIERLRAEAKARRSKNSMKKKSRDLV